MFHSTVYTLPMTTQYPIWGVYKQWNGILEWWNTGMVEYWNGGMEFFKVQYHFLHPNKYNSSP